MSVRTKPGGVSRMRPNRPAELIARNIPNPASMCYDPGAIGVRLLEEYARAGAPGRLGHIGETLLPRARDFGDPAVLDLVPHLRRRRGGEHDAGADVQRYRRR